MDEDRQMRKADKVYDSFEEKDFEMESEPLFLIGYNGSFHHFWEYSMLAIIIYSAFITPFNLCFDNQNPTVRYIDTFIEILLIADIFLSFFTEIQDFCENIIRSSRIIRLTYLKGWFFLDLITCFPATLLEIFIHHNPIIIFIKWFALVRLLKIVKYPFLTNRVLFHNERVDRILKILISWLIMINILSCFYIFIGLNLGLSQSWIERSNLTMRDTGTIYFSSVYMNLLIFYTISLGEFEGINLIEKLYTVFFLLIILFLFPFMIVTFSKFFVDESPDEIRLFSKIEILQKVHKKFGIEKNLKRQIANFLKQNYLKQFDRREEFFRNLSPNVRHELNSHIFKKNLFKFRFFNDQSYDFILFTIPYLQHSKCRKGQQIYSIGIKVDEMFIVIKGNVSLKLGEEFSELEVAILRENNYFGDVFIFTNKTSPFKCNVKSERTELFFIKNEDFIRIKNKYPKNVLKLMEKSMETLNCIHERKKNLLNLLEQEKTKEGVMKKIRLINTFLFERDFNDYFNNDKQFEEVNEFLINNNFQDVKILIEKIRRKKLFLTETRKIPHIFYEKILNFKRNSFVLPKRLSHNIMNHDQLHFVPETSELADEEDKPNEQNSFKNETPQDDPDKKSNLLRNKTVRKILKNELEENISDIDEKFLKFIQKKKKRIKNTFLKLLKIIYNINFEQELNIKSVIKERTMLRNISKIIFDNKEENIIKNIEPEFKERFKEKKKKTMKPSPFAFEKIMKIKFNDESSTELKVTKENSINLISQKKSQFIIKPDKTVFRNLKICNPNYLEIKSQLKDLSFDGPSFKKNNEFNIHNKINSNSFENEPSYDLNNCVFNVFLDSKSFQIEREKLKINKKVNSKIEPNLIYNKSDLILNKRLSLDTDDKERIIKYKKINSKLDNLMKLIKKIN